MTAIAAQGSAHRQLQRQAGAGAGMIRLNIRSLYDKRSSRWLRIGQAVPMPQCPSAGDFKIEGFYKLPKSGGIAMRGKHTKLSRRQAWTIRLVGMSDQIVLGEQHV